MLATLYDVKVNTINYHINKIFEDAELSKESVIRKFRITASDGKSYDALHYGLQMIIAVGFKVDSERAVQFRKWICCPHQNSDKCECKKPKTKFIRESIEKYDLGINKCFVIGDMGMNEIVMAHNAGCKGVLVLTGGVKAK